jgi:hypothetical protein
MYLLIKNGTLVTAGDTFKADVEIQLGMEAPRVNTVARQVPLLSSPGAMDNVLKPAPTPGLVSSRITRVGLPHRYGAHPLAYTFSFYGAGRFSLPGRLPRRLHSPGREGNPECASVRALDEPSLGT